VLAVTLAHPHTAARRNRDSTLFCRTTRRRARASRRGAPRRSPLGLARLRRRACAATCVAYPSVGLGRGRGARGIHNAQNNAPKIRSPQNTNTTVISASALPTTADGARDDESPAERVPSPDRDEAQDKQPSSSTCARASSTKHKRQPANRVSAPPPGRPQHHTWFDASQHMCRRRQQTSVQCPKQSSSSSNGEGPRSRADEMQCKTKSGCAWRCRRRSAQLAQS